MIERKGVVVDIASARRKRGGGFSDRNMTAAANRLENELSAEACQAMLEERVSAPMGEGLKALLEMPPKLYSVGAEPGKSFSSNPAKSVERLAGHLLHDLSFPEDLPDFGIHLTQKGSNAFCVLFDRSRKVIVCQDVQNMFVEHGSWLSFENALRDALSAADSLRADGKDFSFVISRDGLIRII